MHRLADAPAAARWLAGHVKGTLTSDSRALRAGDGFVAWPGAAHDGRAFVPRALAAGAAACLVEAEGLDAFAFEDELPIAALPQLQAAAGAIADIFFDHPSAQLDVLAVTGTNGKTSTAWWVAQALTQLGRRCGLVGTLGIGEPPQAASGQAGSLQSTGLTTPDALTLHAALRRFVDQGCQACALEASSIGLVEQRLTAAQIDLAIFTIYTRAPLDHHGDLAAYWAAFRSLFAWPGLRAAVVNIDDSQGAVLAAELSGRALDLWSVSCLGPARLQALGLHYAGTGLAFDLAEGEQRCPVTTGLVGDYNASNLLGVVGGLRALGVPLAEAAAALSALTPVPGRLQQVEADTGPMVLVDYAHTPDALEKVLQTLRPLAQARSGALVCVFGCGGNRDSSKRPLMGAIAERGADRLVLTSDNPRFEAPAAILAQIVAGLARPAGAEVIEDRGAAIAEVLRSAQPADVVLLAGKGHEDYQDVAGVKRPFSDLLQAQAALRLRSNARSGAVA